MDSLAELSSTPPNAQHQNVLVNAQGNPLKINLQAVELEGRPKLVRTLKVRPSCHAYFFASQFYLERRCTGGQQCKGGSYHLS